jgi:SOS response associated peptidase (SRAP)
MAPTMDAPVVRLNSNGERHLDVLKWGLVPYFTKDLKKARKPINARSETIAKSGMFRAAFAQRRCLVPAPAYYEWRPSPNCQGKKRHSLLPPLRTAPRRDRLASTSGYAASRFQRREVPVNAVYVFCLSLIPSFL